MVLREMERPEVQEHAPAGGGDPVERLDEELELLKRSVLQSPSEMAEGSARGRGLSPGFKGHMKALEELALEEPERILPFLAIDPRRPGILQLMEDKLQGGKGPFKGIKIYPPLGYLPTHPNLEEVYEYCAKHDIPISVHCSVGGFENFRRKNLVHSWTGESHWVTFTDIKKNKSMYYADPENWRPVFQRWLGLRLNFGHFGGSMPGDPGTVNEKWLRTIEELMLEYPNIYADFSYTANLDRKSRLFEFIKASGILKKRAMFGSDFVMITMDLELGGLTKYFDNYAELEEDILYGNASRFLNLQGRRKMPEGAAEERKSRGR